jgi:hypothetical protein
MSPGRPPTLPRRALGLLGDLGWQKPSESAGRKCVGFLAATCPTKREGTFNHRRSSFAKSEAVTQESLGRSPISANLRGRDQDRCWRLEKIGPAGTSRSPVRSAGLVLLKSYPSRPVRRSQAAAFALRATAGRGRNGTIERCRQSLSGMRDQTPSDSIVLTGTDLFFCIISRHFVPASIVLIRHDNDRSTHLHANRSHGGAHLLSPCPGEIAR